MAFHPFSQLQMILAHNLVEARIIDGRKDVWKPRLRARQISENAKEGSQCTTPALAEMATFRRVAKLGATSTASRYSPDSIRPSRETIPFPGIDVTAGVLQ